MSNDGDANDEIWHRNSYDSKHFPYNMIPLIFGETDASIQTRTLGNALTLTTLILFAGVINSIVSRLLFQISTDQRYYSLSNALDNYFEVKFSYLHPSDIALSRLGIPGTCVQYAD